MELGLLSALFFLSLGGNQLSGECTLAAEQHAFIRVKKCRLWHVVEACPICVQLLENISPQNNGGTMRTSFDMRIWR